MSNEERKTLPKRDEVDEKFKWDLTSIYGSDQKWEEEFNKVKEEFPKIQEYRGKLGESAAKLLEGLKFSDGISRKLENLYNYASRKSDEDTTNNTYQGMLSKVQGLYNAVGSASAFIVPEIIQIPKEEIEGFLQEEEGLQIYKHSLDEILRQKEHFLSPKEERLLALAGELAQGPANIFGMINNADMAFPSIKGEDGEEVEVTHGRYVELLKNKNRHIRRDAFKAYYSSYQELENTIATTLNSNIKRDLFYMRARKYNSSLEAALDGNNIPVDVYNNLIKVVSDNLDSMYRYIDLRKRSLGVEELHMYDIYTPIVKDVQMKVSYEEAQDILMKALAPLGEEYLSLLERAFSESWIDIYENKGKRSGAYSASSYDAHPYILMNYTEDIDDLFTLAHELGHALHSYYSNEEQPYIYADYSIFVAEVASTVNEALLMQHLLETTEDEEKRKYILNHYLEQFRGTVYRQTMFAEFEKLIHDKAEEGVPLTPELFSKEYLDLNRKYYGDNITLDEEIGIEWARIPHFYYNFYVYQYATGFSAAIALSRQILEVGEEAVEKYLNFLKGGSSDYPIELLKTAGVDMKSPEPIQEALDEFSKLVEEMKSLV
ncbi:oligoendopeptidase F [Halonatronum saccharophilum]|uniref:oligoendopeptidase F n=1 Tax=Halonatronum saccharophilum TaxID=150060 RepID=UPI0004866FA5|nr:oligoendopeptidase F [Halonatronum saccharophilum]